MTFRFKYFPDSLFTEICEVKSFLKKAYKTQYFEADAQNNFLIDVFKQFFFYY